MEKEEWFEHIGKNNSKNVNKLLETIIEFSKIPEFSKLFETCGVYAKEGILMPGKRKNNIEIILVGLDFRAVFDYSKVFLGDPETLIKEGFFISELPSGDGAEEECWEWCRNALHEPHVEVCEKVKIKDNNLFYFEEFKKMDLGREIINFGERQNRADPKKPFKIEEGIYYLNFEDACFYKNVKNAFRSKINITFLVSDLCDFIKKNMICDLLDFANPKTNKKTIAYALYLQYFKPRETKMVPFVQYKKFEDTDVMGLVKGEIEESDFVGIKMCFLPKKTRQIDFLIHGENIFVPYWKENLQKENKPYIVLHEWYKATSKDWRDRCVFPGRSNLELPDFIDDLGKKRADMSIINKEEGYINIYQTVE